jgi:excisionase family DNA binding protein
MVLSLSTFEPHLWESAGPADNAIMTIGRIADYLKVAEQTVYRLAGARKIPSFKVGGSWRFSKADIDAWIKKQSEQDQGAGQ